MSRIRPVFFVGTITAMAGKPRANRDKVKSNVLRVRLTPGEREMLDWAASVEEAESSTWARQKLLKLAEKVLGEQAQCKNR